MATRNPDRPRTAGGLEPFLGGSLVLHALFAVALGWMLAPTASVPATPAEEPAAAEKSAEEAKPEPRVEERIEAAREEVRQAAAEQLAREQLKPAFEKLTAGLLPPTNLAGLWDDILLDLDSDLLGLAEYLEMPEFDAARFNERVRQLREEMLGKLEEKLRAAEAKALAGPLRQALAEQVGKPLGDALAQAVEAEHRQGQALLQRAAQELDRAALAARQAETTLGQAQRDLDAGTPRAAQAKTTAAQRQLDQARTHAESAAQRLRERHPEIADPVRAASEQVEASRKHLPGETRPAREKAGTAAERLEKLAEAARLQALREQVAHAARQAGQAARGTEQARQQADRAEATARAVAPALEQAKQPEAAAEAKAAQEKLDHGKQALAAQNAQQARPHLNDARDKLDAAGEHLRQAQERLGVKARATPGDAIVGQVEERLQGELARRVEEKLQPLLDRKLDPRTAAELKKQEPGKVVAEAARQRLPGAKHGPHGEEAGPHARAEAEKAEAAALAQLDRLLGPATDRAIKEGQAELAGPHGPGDLLRRVEGLRHGPGGSQQGAHVFGPDDGAGAASLRARVQQARASLGGLARRWDGEAYRRMLEHLQGRGPVVGETVGRRGADGPAEKAGAEADLHPAYVGIGTPPTVEAPAPASERKLPEATFKTHRFSGLPLLADDAVVFDGDLGDWKGVPALVLNPVLKGPGKTVKSRPDKQVAYAAWCGQGLLLAFDVEDTSGALEAAGPLQAFWLLDAVEIYLDTLNTKSSKRGEAHTHQFVVFPFGHKDHPERGGHESVVEGGGLRVASYDPPTIRRAARRTDRGWTLEVLLSKEALRNANLEPGRVVGFNLQVDTGTDLYYYWTAAERFMTSMHPNTWGDVQLLGSDAKVAFVDEAGKKGVEAAVPGKTLRVQVEDPDMNLSPARRDRVGLTLRAASGATRTLVLEETTATSGVFTGSIATTLNSGGDGPPTALPVFEGEEVVAEYLDQVRAYGERNEKATAKLPVASLGTQLK